MNKLSDHITDPAMLEAMARVEAAAMTTPWLGMLAEELIDLLYRQGGATTFWTHYSTRREEVGHALGKDADCYLAYVYERAYPKLVARYRERDYSEQVLAATLRDFNIRVHNYWGMYGYAGIDDYNWLTLHMTASLVQLGRLQFIFDKHANYGTRIYRSRRDGSLVVVAEGGQPVNCRGFISDVDPAFHTVLTENEERITAHLINVHGDVLRDQTVLDLQEYECLLRDGDPVIDIHIPAEGKLDMAACRSSLDEALAFAERYYPEIAYKGFVCASWLLSDELAETLSPESNLVRFSALFTRCAGGEGEHSLIYRWIFGMDKERESYKSHEAVTTLQRGAHRLLDEGRWYRGRSGFIPLAGQDAGRN
ncbi:acyltransferase domain-containing protein [Paenibacillus daejeonensis]|uniref:acyltransferase domain-containing protein n=1 Tax=Paenibacillus daejeonensis TaxID=135193 RepID=UPI00037B735C|nr:acyltransferase domain-containing protein [Paenibacillus daejeonensis]